MLQGSLDFEFFIPISKPNFILDGIFLFLKSVITCAQKTSLLLGSIFEIILPRSILVSFFSSCTIWAYSGKLVISDPFFLWISIFNVKSDGD